MSKKNLLHYFLSAAVFLFLAGFSFSASAETNSDNEPEQYVQVRVIADKTQVKGGETIRLGLEQTIYPKWHVYWKNPGDSGTPTDLQWNLPKGFKVSELEYPVPLKIPYGPLTNYGHEGQIVLLQNLTLPEDIGSMPFRLDAKVNLLVCHEICIPESYDISIVLNGGTKAEPEKINAAEKQRPTEKNWPATFHEEDGNFIIKVITEDVSEIAKAKDFFIAPENWGPIDNNTDAKIDILNSGFQITQKRGERELSNFKTLPIVASYKVDGKQKSFRIITKPDTMAVTANTTENGSITIIQALLFALIGGMILNLMPCVFPVLSMKALSLVNLQEKEEKKARAYGLSYTAGILVSFGIIATTLLLLKAGGSQIGWGFQLQSPAVIIVLTYLLFIIGLNLSSFFELPNHLAGLGQKLTQKSGHSGTFFTGVLATLVATPCTAPFMGAAMGFALTQPASISMLVFLTLGLGLALPYLALCYIPALRSKLPKPGHWMETFRQFLAFPMFLTTAWLVWVLSQQVNEMGVLCALLGLIAIAFVIWLIKVMPEKGIGKLFSKILILASILFIVSSVVIPTTKSQTTQNMEDLGNAEAFTPEKLSTLLEGNDPIFTNMTAAWCITCKVNEKVALSHDKAKNLFEEKNIQYLKGDWTNQNPIITNYLDSFGRSGVPLYVYYGPRNSQSGERPEPVVLPQILTFGVLEKVIQ